jgi:steroid delta-isomerase
MEAKDKIKAVERYIEAFENSDIGIIRDLYAADARLEDPVGTPLREGIEEICKFYEDSMKLGARLALTGVPRCAGNAVAFPFKVTIPGMALEVIDVFEFNEQGKVISMKAYWGPENTTS